MIKKKLSSLLIVLLLIAGCSDDLSNNSRTFPESTIREDNPVIARILSAGFKKKDIVELKDHYLVDGDILFYKKEPASKNGITQGRTKQARADFLVSPSYYNINVFLNTGTFSTIDLNDVLTTVIDAYNNLGSLIHLTRVYSAEEANIEISQSDYLSLGICGQAGFPFSDGRPFDQIYISESTLITYDILNTDQLNLLVAHEIGHCIGLRHTNWQAQGEPYAATIEGTPNGDGASVMNGSTCGNYWAGFSYYDGQAIRVLYNDDGSGPDEPPTKESLEPNEQLLQNEFIRSQDGRFTLYMQGDGNLVVYYYNVALWASNTCCNAAITKCIMQGDGNLVLYGDDWHPYWHTGTHYYPGSRLLMQNDGNLVIYQGSTPRWASNTCCH